MTNYVDLDELRTRVFFEQATRDDRFTWEEITPDPDIAPVFRRFRLTGCAHREVDRDGSLCTHCGHQFEYKAPKMTAARKATARKPRTDK